MTSDFDSSISREHRRNSSRHAHRLSGTLDVTPFHHGSDFTLLADTSLTHSFHTPQSPVSVHATCLHLVRRTQALRPLSSRTPSSNASFTIADVVSTALRTPYSATSRHTPRCLLLHITDFVTSCVSRDSWPAFQLCKPCATCSVRFLNSIVSITPSNRHSDIIPRLLGFNLFSCRTSRTHRITLHHS